MAVTPQFVGQMYEDTLTGEIYRANSLTEGDWTLICSPGSGGGENVEGAGDPDVVTPDFIGQVYKDTDTGNLWRAGSLTIGDWTLELQNAQMKWEPTSFQIANKLALSLAGNTEATSWTLEMSTSGGINLEEDFTLQSLSSSTLITIDQAINAALTVDNCDVLSVISMPALVEVNDQISVTNCPLLATITLPALQTTPILTLETLPSLTSLDLGAFETASTISVSGCDVLTTLGISVFTIAGIMAITGNPSLTDIVLLSWVPSNGGDYNFSDNALSADTVNLALAQGVANAGFVTGVLNLSGGTNAAPTGQGIADAATLSGRGVTVTTN